MVLLTKGTKMQTHLKEKFSYYETINYAGGKLTLALVKTTKGARAGVAVMQAKDLQAGKFSEKIGQEIARGRATKRDLAQGAYEIDGVDLQSPPKIKSILRQARLQEKERFGKTVKYRALLEASKLPLT